MVRDSLHKSIGNTLIMGKILSYYKLSSLG